MGGRDVEQGRRSGGKGIDDEALGVDRNACHLRARRLEDEAGTLVARVFDRRDRARSEEQAGGQVDALLHAAGHDDAADVGHDAPRCRDMAGDRRAQDGQAGWIGILRQPLRAAVGQARLQGAPPGLQGKERGAGTTGKEVEV